MSIPQVLATNSFNDWRLITNTVSNSIGDLATLYDVTKTSTVLALNDLNTRKFNIAGGTVSGATSFASTLAVTGTSIFTGSLTANGNVIVGSSSINSTNGNTIVGGTLNVSGVSTVAGLSATTITSSGLASLASANVVGALSVNTNKFNVVAATGNTTIAGTLNVTGASAYSSTLSSIGDFSVNTNKFNVVAASGNTSVAGTLNVTGVSTLAGLSATTITSSGLSSLASANVVGAFSVNTNKFTVASATGNTTIAGTLNVTGATTQTGLLTVNGNINIGAGSSINSTSGLATFSGNVIGATPTLSTHLTTKSYTDSTFIMVAGAGSLTSSGGSISITNNAGHINLEASGLFGATTFTGDLNVGSPAKFTVAAATGNTTGSGNLTIAGITSLAATSTAALSSTTISSSGLASLASVNVVGAFSVNTNKFTVASATGNTTIAGTLNVTGTSTVASVVSNDITVNTNSNIYSATVTTTATTPALITQLNATSFRSADFIVQAVDATGLKYQTIKLLGIHDGTTADFTEYGTLIKGSACGTFSVDLSGGFMRLMVTPSSVNSTVFKVFVTATKV